MLKENVLKSLEEASNLEILSYCCHYTHPTDKVNITGYQDTKIKHLQRYVA